MSDHRDEAPTPLAALRDAYPSPSVEQRIVDGAMGRALAPKRRILAPALLAAAAAAALVWFASRPAVTTPVERDAPIPAPESVAAITSAAPRTAASRVRYRMTHGKGAVFDVQTRQPDRTEVQLSAGTARFEVEPLPPGGIFAVQTPHLRVEVVGTRFDVAIEGDCSSVKVTEGQVKVLQGEQVHRVSAGESHHTCPRVPAGERWVQDGLAHLVEGRTAQGVAALERYVEAHPGGPLAEEAMFHLALAAHRAGEPAAIERAVTQYLARFPRGARAERVRALRP